MTETYSLLSFSIRHLISSAVAFLVLVFLRTLACQLWAFVRDYRRHGKMPFFLGLRLTRALVCGADAEGELSEPSAVYKVVTRNRKVSLCNN